MKRIIVLFFILLPVLAYSGVNLKNGNFYVSYTDIIVMGEGQDLKIVRTYNSKSTDIGWFGFGWGSDYETFLTVSADGSVVVHENGAGAISRFTPKTSIDPRPAAEKIILKMRKSKVLISEKNATSLIEKLIADAELRQAYEKKYDVVAKLARGTVLYSHDHGPQKLYKVKKGYKRVYNGGKVEFFNEFGKLSKIAEKNNYHIDFAYNKIGQLVSIKDSFAKQLFFSWYSTNRVKEIWSAGNKKTRYKFKDNDIVESKDVADNVFKFSYDGNHNLTSVTYKDNTKMKIDYNSKTQFVTKITNRHGDWVKYDYGSGKAKPDFHYWTEVTKKGISGKLRKNRYEYFISQRKDGSRYTSKIITEVNGLKTETAYNAFRLPERIKRGNRETTFKYNNSGFLTHKNTSNGESIKISYDKKHNKISKVVNKNGWTKFTYDAKGNLKNAVNDKKKAVSLVYNRKGRIIKMIDKAKGSKRILTFKYNALGKPIEIQMGRKKINVVYDNYGAIKKVESKHGHKMAIQVTQAFQSLLSIVKPAGVNLNM